MVSHRRMRRNFPDCIIYGNDCKRTNGQTDKFIVILAGLGYTDIDLVNLSVADAWIAAWLSTKQSYLNDKGVL